MKEVVVPEELAGYQTYVNPGLIPGPIATPTLPSIDAALQPDTEDKYLYFVAIPEGGGAHAFAKDNAAFQKLLEEVRLHMSGRLPEPADFAPAPTDRQRAAWSEADRAARPARLERLRARFADAGVDAYFGVRSEHMRYLTGFALGDGEEKVSGTSGQFLVGGDDLVVLADSRYTIQAGREAPDARVVDVDRNLPARWPELVASVGAKRIAMEAGVISHASWGRLAAAAPDVELVPVEGWVEADRATKEPSEIERIAAACAVSDRALATLLPEIRPGVTEATLALRLEWLIRTGGAEALAFDVACLSGPEAALPHGAPGDRPVLAGAVLLFDFGAQVSGYRSDMTRTLFVGEPTPAIWPSTSSSRGPRRPPSRRSRPRWPAGRAGTAARPSRAAARSTRSPGRSSTPPGTDAHFGHGTGHGIGLATHEAPSLGTAAADTPLPSPTVFSVEPGVYLEGETGVRIEDLVALDAAAGRVARLTQFPREVLVVGD